MYDLSSDKPPPSLTIVRKSSRRRQYALSSYMQEELACPKEEVRHTAREGIFALGEFDTPLKSR